MRLSRRVFGAAVAVITSALAAPAMAQDKWPSKPVTVIVPFGAGGNTDVLARIFADRLSVRLGQQFVIENKAGAGGTTGLVSVAKATADGYTLGVGTGSGLATNPVLMKEKLAYNAAKDFTYVYNIATQPNMWVINPQVPVKTTAELIAWLKANPETAYATSGIGSSQHLCGELLAQLAGVKIVPVAYRASNQIIQDLISGQVKMACDNFSTANEQVKGGNLRAIAVTTPTRYKFAPDVPAFAETLKGFEVLAWFGWVGPANLPKDVVDKLTAELTAIGKEPETIKKLEALGVDQNGGDGPAFAAFAQRERDLLAPIIEKAGIKLP